MAASATYPINSGGSNTQAVWPAGDSSNDSRVKTWSARRQRSQELKQLHESSWTSYWSAYRNEVQPLTDPNDWWRSNESIPTVFKIIETLLPRLVMGMFDSPDWFFVEARNGRSEAYETMCYNLLKQSLEEMDVFPKLYEALRYSLIMGHCWGKVLWREEYEKRQVLQPREFTNREMIEEQLGRSAVSIAKEFMSEEELDLPSGMEGLDTFWVEEEVFNGPDFEWIRLDRVFPDPSGRGEWFVEEIHTTLEDLEDLQEDLDIYNTDMLSALRQHMSLRKAGDSGGLDNIGDARSGTSAGVGIEYAREPETTEHIPEWIVSPTRDGTGVTLWQCWGKVPREQRGEEGVEWRLVIIAEGKYILRDDPSPTPDGRPPYFPIRAITIPGRLYGESITRYVGPLAEQQTRLANMRLDEVFLGVWQQYLFRKNSVVSDNALLMQPGGAIEVNPEPNQGIADTFMVLPRRDVLPSVWNEDTWRQQQAEHAASATDIMQGVGQSDETATGIERKLQQGNARHLLQVMYNDHVVKKELLKRVWKWLQMRLTQPKVVQMQGEEWAEINLVDIQHGIDIVVGGGLQQLNKAQRVQMDQELLEFLRDPELRVNFKIIPTLRKWMIDRGWKNPESYLKTEEEIAQELYQQGQLQAQAAAAQGEFAAGMGMEQAQAEGDMSGKTPSARMPTMPTAGGEASLVGGSFGPSGPSSFT